MAGRTTKAGGEGGKKAAGAKRSRTYSDRERAEALAVLDAEGGVVGRAAKKTGVPEKTLASWASGRVPPEVVAEKEEIKVALYYRLEALAEKIVGLMVRRVEEDAQADPKHRIPFNTAAVAIGVVVDKMKVLKEMPGAAAAGAKPADDLTPEQKRAEAARLLEVGRQRLQLVKPNADERTA